MERLAFTQAGDGIDATIFTAIVPRVVAEISLVNTTAADLNVRINVVPATGAPAASNQIVPDRPVEANRTRSERLTVPLTPGDRLTARASGAGVNVLVVGS